MSKGVFWVRCVLRSISLFMKKRWHAIIAPEEIRACKKAEALKKFVSTIGDIRKEERQEIVFQHRMYKKLGIPAKEYKARIVSMLESRSPLRIPVKTATNSGLNLPPCS